MSVKINVATGSKRFRLTCYEDRGFGGDVWVITQDAQPDIPNDEISSFKLEGQTGIHVEFFNDSDFDKGKTWAEASLTSDNDQMSITNMRNSAGNYQHHKKSGDANIDGKVSAIRITAS